jgi:sigma-B regulation protein RsbU (phosphoserine phosphatase)
MFFLELDREAQEIRWIRAGHDPALVFRKSTGEFTRLDGPGIVLGVQESFVFETQSSSDLRSGDIIVIGTDGIYETADPDNRAFGRERAQDVIQAHCDEPAHAIQQALVSEVRRFRGTLVLEDDITLVVIKVR